MLQTRKSLTIRRRCVLCYKEGKHSRGTEEALKNTKTDNTRCAVCAEKPYLCLENFPIYHKLTY